MESTKAQEKILERIIQNERKEDQEYEDKNRIYARNIFVGFIASLTMAALGHFCYRLRYPRVPKQEYERFDLIPWHESEDEVKSNDIYHLSHDHRRAQTYTKAIKDLEAYLDFDSLDMDKPNLVL